LYGEYNFIRSIKVLRKEARKMQKLLQKKKALQKNEKLHSGSITKCTSTFMDPFAAQNAASAKEDLEDPLLPNSPDSSSRMQMTYV
jgi:hypothetical protein